MAKAERSTPVPVKQISRSILILRGQRVILDSDVTLIYGVSTGRLNEAQKLSELERKLKNNDEVIAAILSAIRELLHPPVPKRRAIGFTADLEEKS
jgi:hypothetical protein